MASSEPLAQSTMTRTSLFSVLSHAEGQGPRTPPLQHLPPLSLGASSEHDHGEEDHESEEDEDSNLESEEEEESVIKEQITIEPLPTSASPHSDIEAPLPEQPDSPRTERQKAVQLRGRIRVLRGGDQRLEEATEILQATEERLDITQRAIFQNRLAELKRHRPDPKKLTQYRPKEYLDDTEVLLLQIKAAVGMAPNVKESLVARMANLHIRKNSMKSNKNKSKGSPTSPTSPTDQLLNAVQIPSGLDYESKYAESVHSSLKSFVVVSRKALPVHMMPSVPEDSELDSSTLRRAAAVKRYDKHGQGGERYPRMSHEHETSGEYDRHRSVDPEAVTELLPPEVDSGRPKRDRDDRHKSRRDRDRYKDDYYDRDRDRERRHRRDRERSDDPNYVDDRDRDKDRSRRERRKRDKYKEREPEDGEEKQGDKPEDGGDGEPVDGEHAERPRDQDRKRSRRDGRDRRRDRYYDYDKEYEERRRREKEERRERRRKEREEEEHRISTQHEGGAEGEPFHAEGGDVATQEFHDAPEPQSGPEHGEHDHSEEPTSAGGLERSDSGLHRHGSSRKKRDSEAHDQGSDKEPDQPDPNPADEDGGKVKEHERDRDRERDREKDRDRKDKYRDRDRDRDRDRPRRHRRDYDYDRDRDRDRDRKYRDDDYERHRSSRRHRDYPEDDDHHRSSRRHRSDRERERDRERDREQPSSSSKRHSRDREYERGPDGEVPADPNYSRHRRRREDDRQPSSSDYLQPGFGGVGREADPGIPLGAHAQAPTFIGYPESINAGFDSMPKRHHRSRSDNVRPSKHDQQEA